MSASLTSLAYLIAAVLFILALNNRVKTVRAIFHLWHLVHCPAMRVLVIGGNQ